LEITKNRLHDVVEGVGVGAVDAFNSCMLVFRISHIAMSARAAAIM
jgi:hypothetical protein